MQSSERDNLVEFRISNSSIEKPTVGLDELEADKIQEA